MSLNNTNVNFIELTFEGNYYSVIEQDRLKSTRWFGDRSIPSMISGSNSAQGLLDNRNKNSILEDSIGKSYLTSSTTTDSSGNTRLILSAENDYLLSSSYNRYKNGVEILQEKDWASGLVKITAGSAGHSYEFMRYGMGLETGGISSLLNPSTGSVEDSSGTERTLLQNINFDVYDQKDSSESNRKIHPGISLVDLEKFNPVDYVSSNNQNSFLVTKSENLDYGYMDGVIEPFTIRSVLDRSSIDCPYEARSFKGQFGNGNINYRHSSDSVLSLDYVRPASQKNLSFYLDEDCLIPGFEGNSNNKKQPLKISTGYINLDENRNLPFVDVVFSRGISETDLYDQEFLDVLMKLPPLGETYVSENQHSATCGFVYDNATAGTDSIAYGGLLY